MIYGINNYAQIVRIAILETLSIPGTIAEPFP